jgi:hypothetical protein
LTHDRIVVGQDTRYGSHRREVRQNLKADFLAFFRVELGGQDVVAPDAADERAAVVGCGGDDGWIVWDDVVAVDEIYAAPL